MMLFFDAEAAVALAGKVEAVELINFDEEHDEVGITGLGFLVGGAAALEARGKDGSVPIDFETGRGLGEISALAHGMAGQPCGAGDVVLVVEFGDAAGAHLPALGLIVEDSRGDRLAGPVSVLGAADIDVETKAAGVRVGFAESEHTAGGVAFFIDAQDDGLAEGMVTLASGGLKFCPNEGAFIGCHDLVATPRMWGEASERGKWKRSMVWISKPEARIKASVSRLGWQPPAQQRQRGSRRSCRARSGEPAGAATCSRKMKEPPGLSER